MRRGLDFKCNYLLVNIDVRILATFSIELSIITGYVGKKVSWESSSVSLAALKKVYCILLFSHLWFYLMSKALYWGVVPRSVPDMTLFHLNC